MFWHLGTNGSLIHSRLRFSFGLVDDRAGSDIQGDNGGGGAQPGPRVAKYRRGKGFLWPPGGLPTLPVSLFLSSTESKPFKHKVTTGIGLEQCLSIIRKVNLRY